MSKISVIIPVYKAEKYLSKCLDSVLNQTYKNIEIICINDVSPDDSGRILNEYAQKDKRIRVINNEKNQGAALTRNVGIDNAKGEYIYFIDADDYIDSKYLESMAEKAETKDCDIVLNININSECDNKISPFKHPSMPDIPKEGGFFDKITAIHDAPCFIWARMYKKEFLDKNNLRFLDIHATDDVVFNAITTVYTDKTYIYSGETYHYTVNDTGVTGVAKAVDDRDLQHIKAHDMIYDFLKERNKYPQNLKLFRVYPFMKVDTEEKFVFYKKFFEKIENDFRKNENIYNDMEKYFINGILNTASYEEYLKNYNKIVTIGFIRSKK